MSLNKVVEISHEYSKSDSFILLQSKHWKKLKMILGCFWKPRYCAEPQDWEINSCLIKFKQGRGAQQRAGKDKAKFATEHSLNCLVSK